MPTGYTAPVQDGEITEFKDFALNCARAFGALVLLRDDPTAPIPDEFEPSPYYTELVEKARQALDHYKSAPDSVLASAQDAEIATAEARREQYLDDLDTWRARYDAMLAKVVAWKPPTAEHQGLKQFMEDQLRESLRFDVGNGWGGPKVPKKLPIHEYRHRKIMDHERQLESALKSLREERERAAERTAWVKALRESLS